MVDSDGIPRVGGKELASTSSKSLFASVTPPLAVVVLQVRGSSIMTMSSMGSKPRRVPNRELRPAETNIPAPVHGQEILSEPEEREKRWKEELDEKMAAEEEKRELLGVPQVVLGKVLFGRLFICLFGVFSRTTRTWHRMSNGSRPWSPTKLPEGK